MRPKWGAHYRCVSCGWEFVGFAGPEQNEDRLPPRSDPYAPSDPTGCKACGSVYMRWLNYEQMFG